MAVTLDGDGDDDDEDRSGDDDDHDDDDEVSSRGAPRYFIPRLHRESRSFSPRLTTRMLRLAASRHGW